MRLATLLALSALVACNDVREFQGPWHGARVGDNPVLRIGIAPTAQAMLAIDQIDVHGFKGTLTIDGLVQNTFVESMPSAEADVLAGMTWTGSPLRVYLGFFAVPDGRGDALAMIALYDDHRIELRVLRGGAMPLYGIFALSEGS